VVTELFGYYPDTSAVVVEDGGQHSLQVALVSEPRADVSGIVSDGTTGIPGVYMQLLDVPVEIIQTGGDGSYLFADLPVGNYTLVAGLFGWLPVYRSIEVTQGDRPGRELHARGRAVRMATGVSIHRGHPGRSAGDRYRDGPRML
jgi:hypothetical protein